MTWKSVPTVPVLEFVPVTLPINPKPVLTTKDVATPPEFVPVALPPAAALTRKFWPTVPELFPLTSPPVALLT